MPLKEKFNITYSSCRNKRHSLPHRAAGGIPAFSQDAEASNRFSSEPLLGFLWERQGRAL